MLNDWATDPDESHVAVTPDDSDLEELFKDLAANITKTGATDIVIDEIIDSDFKITGVSPPSKGTATMMDANTIQWKIDELGVVKNEGASLEFFIKHIGESSGDKKVNKSITYKDNETNVAIFPSPTVTVNCGYIVNPEPCPQPVDISMAPCSDFIEFDAGEVCMTGLGRILQLDFTVKNVCPEKRVAVAVFLTEINKNGAEESRGMKTFTLPAHYNEVCKNINVKGVKFVLPEDLSSFTSCQTMCRERNFKAKFLANYIDTDFNCVSEPQTDEGEEE